MGNVLDDSFPLSDMQLSLLLGSLRAPGKGIYIQQSVADLSESLDETVFKRAWERAAQRHLVFRTAFFWIGQDEPVQRVFDEAVLPWRQEDWSNLSQTAQQERLEAYLKDDRQRGFDLESPPLMRFALFKVGEKAYKFIWSYHHALLDGRSRVKILKEVFTDYDSLTQGDQRVFPSPTPFKEHILAIQNQDLAAAERFWRNRLAGFSPDSAHILGYPPNHQPDMLPFGEESYRLNQTLSDQLRFLAKECNVTLNNIVQGAWSILLSRYLNTEDILFGAVRACRHSSIAESDEIIGLLMNTLPLRVKVSPQAQLIPWLAEIRTHWHELRQYENTPLSLIKQWCRIPGDQPFFDSLLMFEQRSFTEAMQFPEPEWQPRYFYLYERTDAPLTLCAYAESELLLTLLYDANRFPVWMITAMLAHLATLLEGMAIDPNRTIASLPMLTLDERRKLLEEWNHARARYAPQPCIHQIFETQVDRFPDAVAVVFRDQRISYQELNERANQLAHYLLSQELKPGSLVGICMERSLELVIGILAILKAGGAYVPLDPAYPVDRLKYMLDQTAAPVLLTQQRLVSRLPTTSAQTICLDRDWAKISLYNSQNPATSIQSDSLAYIIFTSGSTGRPNGVMVSHANVTRLFQATQDWFHFTHQDAWTLFHSFAFDFSVWEMWGALLYGGRLIVPSFPITRAPDVFYQLLAQEGITVLCQTPSAFYALTQAEARLKHPLPLRLKTIIFGGEALDYQRLRPWYERHPDDSPVLVNMYGITETTVHATYRRLHARDLEFSPGSMIGRALPDLKLYILDKTYRPVPPGVPGELFIGGAGVSYGYLNNPELTSKRFIPDPFYPQAGDRIYKTGDWARYTPDGDIQFLGRMDHQVKLRGFRVELGEIESLLLQIPGVLDACVILHRKNTSDNLPEDDVRLIAYVVSNPQSELHPGQLYKHLAGKLPDYMLPSAFVFLDRLPLTPNGKLDRRSLPDLESNCPDLSVTYIAPRNPTEETLAAIWAECLWVDRVGIEDNFFEQGGHSLLVISILAHIRQIFGIDIPLDVFFESPTIACLAEIIAKSQALPVLNASSPQDDLVQIKKWISSGPAPLSYAQQRLWFISLVYERQCTYNQPYGFMLEGELDIPALELCLNQLVQRHESLRTRFIQLDGLPAQEVIPSLQTVLTVKDLSDLASTGQMADVFRICTEEARHPFNLAEAPLMRATLFRIGPEKHIFLVTFHHIIIDERSIEVIFHELGLLYEAIRSGSKAELPELPARYLDFTMWQRDRMDEEYLEKEFHYWQKKLSDSPTSLELPADHPKTNRKTYQGATRSIDLPISLLQALQASGRQEKVTFFTLILAAFQVLISRYTGQIDFLIGTPITNRNQQAFEGLVGFFLNTLALRTDLSGNPPFRTFLHQVAVSLRADFGHAELPFDYLVERLNPERINDFNPLVQVLLVVTQSPRSSLRLPRITTQSLDITTQTSKLDLTLTVHEDLDNFQVSIEYDSGLFSVDRIERMLAHIQTLLKGITADPNLAISDLPILLEIEKHQILVDWNTTWKEYPRQQGIHEFFEAQVEKTPESLAVIFEDHALNYRELNNRSNQLARYLHDHGVGPDIIIAVYLERSIDLLIALLAILKAGGAYLPLDLDYPPERVNFMLADSGSEFVITHSKLISSLDLPPGCSSLCLDLIQDDVNLYNRTDLKLSFKPARLAYLLYTSGSTGQPKGVLVEQTGLTNFLLAMQAVLDFSSKDIGLAFTTLSFDIAALEIFLPLISGARLLLTTREVILDPNLLIKIFQNHHPTFMQATPTSWQTIIDAGWAGSPELTILCGGEVLPPNLAKTLLAHSKAVWNEYGPTETTIYSTIYPVSGVEEHSIPIGRPIANTLVFILDPNWKPVPIGVPGELYIGGAGVSRGYLNRPDLTSKCFIPNPFGEGLLYKTGDRVRWLPDSNIEFLGRYDDQIKLRGFRIEPGEIEAALCAHPDIRQALVMLREDHPGDRRLIAYIVATPGSTVTAGKLRSFLERKLPEYMLPSAYVYLDQFPLTQSGKVNRQALQAPDTNLPVFHNEFNRPRTPLEKIITNIWKDVLGIPQVGINDNFFELGGDSLLAIRVISRMRETLKVETALRTFFEAPTIRGICFWIEQYQKDHPETQESDTMAII